MAKSIQNTQKYNEFVCHIKEEISQIFETGNVDLYSTNKLLNGAASEALINYVPKTVRSEYGIFFSGHELSQYVASLIKERLKNGASVADPTCGAGDLLLACAEHYQLEKSFLQTVNFWGRKILGFDLHDEFVDTAKARLILLAAKKHFSNQIVPSTVKSSTAPFKQIQTLDYLHNLHLTRNIDCIVMNPPFGKVQCPAECKWAKGTVQLAGIFLDKVLEVAKDGQEIVAVLPDVLRSGTRYKQWRKAITRRAKINHIHVFGRFDQKTDVDVFVLHLTKHENVENPIEDIWSDFSAPTATSDSPTVVSDLFNVSVGAFVLFRQKEIGAEVPYLPVSDAIPCDESTAGSTCIFDGTLHEAPFVVIRRTSNPSDIRRVVPTLITDPQKMAVDNHLIVLSPKDRSLQTCRKLLHYLLQPEIDKWMNNAIRCRHLTTTVTKKLPLIDW